MSGCYRGFGISLCLVKHIAGDQADCMQLLRGFLGKANCHAGAGANAEKNSFDIPAVIQRQIIKQAIS